MDSPSQENQLQGQVWALDWFAREIVPELPDFPNDPRCESLRKKVFDTLGELSDKVEAHLIGQDDYIGRCVILGVIDAFLERKYHNQPPFYFVGGK